jgi:hypothetical protein
VGPGTNNPRETFDVESATTTAQRPGTPVRERGWAPTVILCVAVLLAAGGVVVARPLAAGASPGIHGRSKAVRRAQTVSEVTSPIAVSPNWSGYVSSAPSVNDGSFNQVSAEWTEPRVTCPRKNAWTLFWVGFDGWPATDGTVEQGGTSARCLNGVAQYSAFYEMWPTQAVTTTFPINALDTIEASVAYSSSTGVFTITVTDVTTGASRTEYPTCPTSCSRTSAEWIAESPSHFGTDSWFPLADYGTVRFTSATATNDQGASGPISFTPTWSASGIERRAGGAKPKAEVSALWNAGTTSTFSDTWQPSRGR